MTQKAALLTFTNQVPTLTSSTQNIGDPVLISVVIVTWNRRDDIIETIQSVYMQDYKRFEIIVVDNASTDNTVGELQNLFPDVLVVALQENRGAAGGRNPGIKAAQGDIIFFLDSDASLAHNTLSKIVERFAGDTSISGITCKVLLQSTGQIDPYGWLFTEDDKVFQNIEFDSYAFSEGAAAFRREVFSVLEPFWEFLFYGREGEELAVRAWDKGFRIIFFPEAIVYHRVSSRTRVTDERQLFYDLRNSLAICIRNYPWWFLVFVASLRLVSSLVKGIKYRNLYFFFRALANVLQHLPYLLQQRKPVQHSSARHYWRIQRQHGPFRWSLSSWLKYNKYEKL